MRTGTETRTDEMIGKKMIGCVHVCVCEYMHVACVCVCGCGVCGGVYV